MDTLFSTHRLSGSRLARLIIASPEQQASLIWKWYPANDNQHPRGYLEHYGKTRAGVRDFHRRNRSAEELRAEAESWRIQGLEPEHGVFRDNARALIQYLDEHGDRDLLVVAQQKLEAYVSGLRVTTEPHLCAVDGSQLCWIWLECSEVLNVELAHAKANVTLLMASKMGIRAPARAEVVHAATKRIVSHEAMPPGFSEAAAVACAHVQSTWERLDQTLTLASRPR
jgi:hypothetical protein